jgi:hypothetical protein
MLFPSRVAVTLAAAGAIAATAVPTAASARQPTGASVVLHAKRADRALAAFKREVARHHKVRAARFIRAARHETAVAGRQARIVRAAAVQPTQLPEAAGAVTVAGDQYGQLATMISQCIAQVHGMLQQILAQILPSAINMQNQLLAMLNQMLGQIPQASQPQLATAITNVAASGASALPPLQQALTSHALPVDIAGIVASAFNTATTALQAALGTVNSVLPTMPAVAQGPIQQVLSMVTSILNTVIGQIGSFVPGAGGSSSGSSTSGGLAGGITGIVGGVLSQVQSLLGNLFGNLFGGFGFGSPTVVVNN